MAETVAIGDNRSRELMEKILLDEEHRIDWPEARSVKGIARRIWLEQASRIPQTFLFTLTFAEPPLTTL